MTLIGAVDRADTVAVLDKCLAECPAAMVMDLRHVEVATVAVSQVLNWRDRAEDAGVALEFVAIGELARRIGCAPGHYRLGVHLTAARAARAALDRPGRRWVRQRFAAGPLASSMARDTVSTMCLAWGLRPLLYPARLVASELVDNAVTHARTDMELTVGVTTSYLHIRVRDWHPALPERRPIRAQDSRAPLDLRGTGLTLLSTHATCWGSIRQPGGKTVWATLLLPAPSPS